MKYNQGKSKGPKDAATSKGPNAKAMEAIALSEDYTNVFDPCKEKPDGPAASNKRTNTRARAKALATRTSGRRAQLAKVAFDDSVGRKWAYRGNRGWGLAMLAPGARLLQAETGSPVLLQRESL